MQRLSRWIIIIGFVLGCIVVLVLQIFVPAVSGEGEEIAYLPLIYASSGETAATSTPEPTATATAEPTSTPTSGSGCPSDDFQDVSTYNQTQDYPNPKLSVTCDDDTMTIVSNGIPNFEFVSITPNDLEEQDYTWEITLNPEEAASTTTIPLGGPVAVAVNGLPIYGPNEAPTADYGDPYLDGILDYCNGHTAQQGVYHLHARPDCIFTDLEGNTSLVVAYAFDGFPILAPYVCEDSACTSVKEVESSWVRTQDVTNAWEAHEYIEGSGDLDECNGMVGSDGTYRYYATDTFPYFLGCYKGTSSVNNGPDGRPQR